MGVEVEFKFKGTNGDTGLTPRSPPPRPGARPIATRNHLIHEARLWQKLSLRVKYNAQCYLSVIYYILDGMYKGLYTTIVRNPLTSTTEGTKWVYTPLYTTMWGYLGCSTKRMVDSFDRETVGGMKTIPSTLNRKDIPAPKPDLRMGGHIGLHGHKVAIGIIICYLKLIAVRFRVFRMTQFTWRLFPT